MRQLTPIMEDNLRKVVREESLTRHQADPLVRRRLITGRRGKYKLTFAGMKAYNRIGEDDQEESAVACRFA